MITEVRNINYLPNRPKWFLDKSKSGGGIVMNYGAHTLDKIMYITGDTVQEAFANLQNPLSDDNVEINAQILMKMRTGTSVSISYCGCPGWGAYESAFYFEKGVAKIYGGSTITWAENGDFLPCEEKNSDALARQFNDFVKLLKGEETNIVTPEYGREIIRVLEGILD